MRTFIVVAIVSLVFSSWLMFHTFSYDSKTGSMLISDKVWSDFSGHLPLIRSFSKGQNWPPENPLFPGEPIRYHFLFFMLVGWLEKIGVRIDWAMNVPSILGFWGLLLMLYLWTYKFFKNWLIGVLALILFLFNGSLSFVTYFVKHGLSLTSFWGILTNSSYPNFGPWDGGKIAAVWNLNIYTNQRHLAPGLAIALLVLYLANFKKIHPVFMGLLIGFLIFLNEAVFAGLAVFLVWHFLLNKKDWKFLVLSGLCAFPWFLLSRVLINANYHIQFHPGFLMADPLTPLNFLVFWWQNLGLYLALLPVGIYFAPWSLKKMILPILTLFAIVNLFQLSPDMFNNHKLLNFDMCILVMLMAGVFLNLWKIKPLRLILPALLLFFVFSGLIDFFALKNDHRLTMVDATNPDITFVEQHTAPKAVFLNSTWLYHPASLAGRPIFSGYTYFTWSHGYDSYGREKILKDIYMADSKVTACNLLTANHISFVELNEHPESYLQPNFSLWRNEFKSMYNNPKSGVTFYDVEASCHPQS